MKILRKIIEIDEEKCDGCGQCVPSCAEGAIIIVDGKAKVVSNNLCDGLGACISECPNDALKIVEKEAEEFDEAAVDDHLTELKTKEAQEKTTKPAACPSSLVQTFSPCDTTNKPATSGSAVSSLSHWPCQIRLVPPNAPFLKHADLLIPADCVCVAFPTLHNDFLKGRAVMMGCPKFDDVDAYIAKFTEVFREAGIKSITCVIMEVPCCAGLPAIIKKAMKASGVKIPMKTLVISTAGEIMAPQKIF